MVTARRCSVFVLPSPRSCSSPAILIASPRPLPASRGSRAICVSPLHPRAQAARQRPSPPRRRGSLSRVVPRSGPPRTVSRTGRQDSSRVRRSSLTKRPTRTPKVTPRPTVSHASAARLFLRPCAAGRSSLVVRACPAPSASAPLWTGHVRASRTMTTRPSSLPPFRRCWRRSERGRMNVARLSTPAGRPAPLQRRARRIIGQARRAGRRRGATE
jgi:hypothetical protein